MSIKLWKGIDCKIRAWIVRSGCLCARDPQDTPAAQPKELDVSEKEGPRTQCQSETEGPDALVCVVPKGWTSWSLVSTVMAAAKHAPNGAFQTSSSFLFSLYLAASQWMVALTIRVGLPTLFAGLHANHLWKHPTNTPRSCVTLLGIS